MSRRSPLKVDTANLSSSKSYDSVDSGYLGSFTANLSPNNPKFQSLERIINYLTEKPDMSSDREDVSPEYRIKQAEYFKSLSELTLQTLTVYKDPVFLRVLKAYGWTGTRFSYEKKLFDRNKFLQAVSNIYLKFQYNKNPYISSEMMNPNDPDNTANNINHFEKLAAFSPDLVVECLEKNPSILLSSEILPMSYSFVGCCMIVDISGFSKFSAAKCSKGVKGLDELRNITNGLLGQFVKSVYEHEGDVIAFAGDALICVFPDKSMEGNYLRRTSAPILTEEDMMDEPLGDEEERLNFSLKFVHPTIRAMHSANILKSVQFVELSTHIGISYGEMKLVFLGGHNGQWSYVVNGPCLSELHDCLENASAEMVVITETCYLKLAEIQSHSHSYEKAMRENPPGSRNSGTFFPFNSYDGLELNYPTYRFSEIASSPQNDSHSHSENKCFYKLDDVSTPDPNFEASISGFLGRKIIAHTATNLQSDFSNSQSLSQSQSNDLPTNENKSQRTYLSQLNKSNDPVVENINNNNNDDNHSDLGDSDRSDNNTGGGGGTLQLITNLTPKGSSLPQTQPTFLAQTKRRPTRNNSSLLLKSVHSNLSEVKYKRMSSRSISVRNIPMENVFPRMSSYRTSSQRTVELNEPERNSVNIQLKAGKMNSWKTATVNRYRSFIESLSLFVPMPIVSSLSAEANHQIGELRTVTTMFLCLNSFDPIIHADPITLQPFFLIAQQALDDSGGFLRQFLVDDKGCVLIGMWGMPSYTYANNCSRALHCAVLILKRISEVNHRCSIGITTGTVFCGTIGALERCDYVGIGSDVNLAARFMAKANGHIFVDENTYNNLNEKNRSLLLPYKEEILFKGIPNPIRPYMYNADCDQLPSLHDVDSKLQTKSKLLKRKIMHLLDKSLDKLTNKSPPLSLSPPMLHHNYATNIRAPSQLFSPSNKFQFKSRRYNSELRNMINHYSNNVEFLILCGQPGVGKGTAAQYFRIGARDRGIQTIHLIAQSKHRNIPYAILRELFLELVGPENFKSITQQISVLKNLIADAYPEEDYTDFDRFHVRLVIELILGINNLQNEKQFQDHFQSKYASSAGSHSPIPPPPSGGTTHSSMKLTPIRSPAQQHGKVEAIGVSSDENDDPQIDSNNLDDGNNNNNQLVPRSGTKSLTIGGNNSPDNKHQSLNNEIDEEFRYSVLKEYLTSPICQRQFSYSQFDGDNNNNHLPPMIGMMNHQPSNASNISQQQVQDQLLRSESEQSIQTNHNNNNNQQDTAAKLELKPETDEIDPLVAYVPSNPHGFPADLHALKALSLESKHSVEHHNTPVGAFATDNFDSSFKRGDSSSYPLQHHQQQQQQQQSQQLPPQHQHSTNSLGHFPSTHNIGASGSASNRYLHPGDQSASKRLSNRFYQPSVLTEENEHQIFFNIIAVCLRNAPLALIIENAHFCDELTWNSLYLLLTDTKNLDVSVLITLKSNPVHRLRSTGRNNSKAGGPDSSGPGTGRSFHTTRQNSPQGQSYYKPFKSMKSSRKTSSKDPFRDANNLNNSTTRDSLEGRESIGGGGGRESIQSIDEEPELLMPYEREREKEKEKEKEREKPVTFNRGANFPDGQQPMTLLNRKNQQLSTTSIASIASRTDDPDQMIYHYGLDNITCDSFRNILRHNHCLVYEMKNLSEDEVKLLLLQKLKVDFISEELVKTVFKVSSGNAYWCNMIVQFIEERGIHNLLLDNHSPEGGGGGGMITSNRSHTDLVTLGSDEEDGIEDGAEVITNDQQMDRILNNQSSFKRTANQSGKSTKKPAAGSSSTNRFSSSTTVSTSKQALASIQTLRSLIICRLELLSSDSQLILKYASIIGSEFTPYLLQSILPIKFQDMAFSTEDIDPHEAVLSIAPTNPGRRQLSEVLEQLEKHGFLSCVTEFPTAIYTLQNEVIQKTLYELIPPSDAAAVHIQIAQYLEKEYSENLRPFYPALASHYKFGYDYKNAFKFEIKSAALAVSSGAFNDGYRLAESSLDLLQTEEEIDIVIQVCNRAIDDLQLLIITIFNRSNSGNIQHNPYTSFFNSGAAARNGSGNNGQGNGMNMYNAADFNQILNSSTQMIQKFSQSVISLIFGGSTRSNSSANVLGPAGSTSNNATGGGSSLNGIGSNSSSYYDPMEGNRSYTNLDALTASPRSNSPRSIMAPPPQAPPQREIGRKKSSKGIIGSFLPSLYSTASSTKDNNLPEVSTGGNPFYYDDLPPGFQHELGLRQSQLQLFHILKEKLEFIKFQLSEQRNPKFLQRSVSSLSSISPLKDSTNTNNTEGTTSEMSSSTRTHSNNGGKFSFMKKFSYKADPMTTNTNANSKKASPKAMNSSLRLPSTSSPDTNNVSAGNTPIPPHIAAMKGNNFSIKTEEFVHTNSGSMAAGSNYPSGPSPVPLVGSSSASSSPSPFIKQLIHQQFRPNNAMNSTSFSNQSPDSPIRFRTPTPMVKINSNNPNNLSSYANGTSSSSNPGNLTAGKSAKYTGITVKDVSGLDMIEEQSGSNDGGTTYNAKSELLASSRTINWKPSFYDPNSKLANNSPYHRAFNDNNLDDFELVVMDDDGNAYCDSPKTRNHSNVSTLGQSNGNTVAPLPFYQLFGRNFSHNAYHFGLTAQSSEQGISGSEVPTLMLPGERGNSFSGHMNGENDEYNEQEENRRTLAQQGRQPSYYSSPAVGQEGCCACVIS